MNDIKAIGKIDRANVGVMLALGAISAITLSWPITVGLLAGCAVMTVDFFVLRKLLARLLIGETRSAAISMGLLVVKFLGLFVMVALCLYFLPMNLFAFGLGATAVVVTAALVSTTVQMKTKEE